MSIPAPIKPIETQYGKVAGTGIEPDVKNVVFLAELCSATFAARCSRRHQLSRRTFVPDVSRMLGEQPHDTIQDLAISKRFTASIAIEHDDRNTPDALP